MGGNRKEVNPGPSENKRQSVSNDPGKQGSINSQEKNRANVYFRETEEKPPQTLKNFDKEGTRD